MVTDGGNGHHETIEEMAQRKAGEHAFEGATVSLKEFQREDGIMAQAADKANSFRRGVIDRVITATSDDKEYRQILKQGLWKSTEEQDKAVNALAECDVVGAVNAKKYILDRITAHSAGINGYLLHEALEALTHTTFTTQHIENQRRRNGNYERGSTRPIP